MSNNPREIALIKLLTIHINPTQIDEPEAVNQAASLFLFLSDGFVRKASDETFYSLPYREITNFIFNNECEFESDEFLSFTSVIYEKMQNLDDYNQSPYKEYLGECYNKLTLHISLAQVQKSQIIKVTKEAYKVAQKAEKLASEADAQAKSTVANYISILGIFASIIFTLFGGVNLIGSTVKLLETGSKWPYLTFIISLLMICLLTLLNMMVKWINSMSNLKNALEKENRKFRKLTKYSYYNPLSWSFYTKAVSCFLIVLLISMCGMYHVKKEEFKSHTKEITSQMESSKREEKSNKNNDTQSNKPSMTIVEKTTVSNHLSSSKDDK